jgi:mRNA-degrading endonuclease RelE of RelBE toxin-antitoxin system
MKYFETLFLDGANTFLESLNRKASAKILYNIDLAEKAHDPKLFKKLNKNFWEFRTRFGKNQYRLFAFWDNEEKTRTLVIATHGIIKKNKR